MNEIPFRSGPEHGDGGDDDDGDEHISMPAFTYMDELLINVESSVQRRGQHIQYVLGDEDLPPWAYTIGMTDTLGHPELVVFGVDPESSMGILNDIYERLRNGRRFDIGRYTHELVGDLSVRFLPVPTTFWESSSLFAMWINYYGSLDPRRYPVPDALQLVWADSKGRFPWDRGYERRLVKLQPILEDLEPDDLGIGWEGAA